MKRWSLRLSAWLLILLPLVLLAPLTWAQSTGQISGEVLDLQGKPYPGVVVTITNKGTGQIYTVKTDKDGRYRQIGLVPAVYQVNFKKDNINYSVEKQIAPGENTIDENFKEIAAKMGYNEEAEKKKEEEAKKKFQNLKLHFDAGVAAMKQAEATKQQLDTATGTQRAALQSQMQASYQTAIGEFQQAQQAAGQKDPNLPLILGNLGVAYDGVGKYQEAVQVLEQSTTLKPSANQYMQLGTDLAYVGKVPEAGAACDKAAALDPTDQSIAAACYKNIGIVLFRKSKLQDAVAPLEKATQLNPKDADAWFLLGSCLTGSINTKEQGGKMIYIIPPGTAEAYQKYLDLAPNGPHAADAKASLASIQQMGGGSSTTVVNKKEKKH